MMTTTTTMMMIMTTTTTMKMRTTTTMTTTMMMMVMMMMIVSLIFPAFNMYIGKVTRRFHATSDARGDEGTCPNVKVNQVEFWHASRNMVLAFGSFEDGWFYFGQ